MSTTITDAQLVTAFLAGDRGALAAIYDRYAASLYDTAAAMLSDRHDAADMVQDVFCVAVERLGQLRDPERLKPWLFAVLRNEVYRRTRKRRRATPTDFSAEGVSDVVAPRDPSAEGESVEYEELASLVRSAAAGLDERDQLVLELSVRQGLAGADLADALGVSPEQSYSMVHRMRERVDKSIGAFIVARTGRRDCPTLAEILRGWDGEFNVLVRKRVARHVDSCSVCERKRGAVAPLALFAAAPAFILPIGLREQVLAAATPLPGSTMPARSAHSARRIRLNRHDGFPRAARFARHAVAWGAGATAAIVVGATVVVVAGRDDSGRPTTDPVVVVTEAPDDAESPDDTVVTVDTSVVDIVDDVQDDVDDDQDFVDGGASSTAPLTPPVTVRPASPATTAPVVTVPVPVTTQAPATTKAPTPTNAPATTPTPTTTAPVITAPTTTVARYNGAYLSANAKSVLFGTAGTTGSVTLTNPSPRPVTWNVTAPTTASTFFSFSPSSGTLEAGKTVKVSITFARSSAADYANTSAFPETANFSHTANFTATGADGGTTGVSLALTGKVTRPPLVRQASISFSGNACVNSTVTVRAVDESGVKSVVGTATLVNNDGTTASRSLVFTNQGDKIGWTAPVNDLATRTVEVMISVSVTDNLGLSTPVNLAQKRPTTC